VRSCLTSAHQCHNRGNVPLCPPASVVNSPSLSLCRRSLTSSIPSLLKIRHTTNIVNAAFFYITAPPSLLLTVPSSVTAIVLIGCSVFCFEHDVRTAVNKNGRGSSVCVVGPLTYISTWPMTNYGARATSLSRSPAYPTSIVPTHFYTVRPIQIFISRFRTSRYVK